MKKKVLLSSILTIALCLSLIAGSTYALFTSTKEFNVAITSGTVDLTAGIDIDQIWSVEPTDGGSIVDEKGGTYEYVPYRNNFANGGTAVISGAEVTLTNVTPGDKVDLIVSGTNNSNVTIQYRYVIECTEGLELMHGLKVYVNGATEGVSALKYYTSGWMEFTVPVDDAAKAFALPVTIELPVTAGNEYQNKTTKIKFTVEAVQGNAATVGTQPEFVTFDTVATTAEDLGAAFAAGESVVLAADLVVDNKVSIPKNTSVTLDLNGHTLSGAFSNQGVSAVIDNNGTLTITNGTVASLAQYPDVDWGTEGFPTYATNTISNKGNLVIEEGTVIENQTNQGGASYAIDNYPGATLTVNGGIIKAQDVAIRLFSGSATAENKVVINGGEISGKRAIWIHLPGGSATVAPLTTVEINGGNFKSTSDLTIYSYSYGNSYANTNVTITGGTFEKAVAFGAGYYGDKENVTITGGVFNGELGRYLENNGWEDIVKP